MKTLALWISFGRASFFAFSCPMKALSRIITWLYDTVGKLLLGLTMMLRKKRDKSPADTALTTSQLMAADMDNEYSTPARHLVTILIHEYV